MAPSDAINQSTTNEVEIYDTDSYGRGVGKHEGKIVFVPFTVPEDIVEYRTVASQEKYDIGEAIRIIKPSPSRETPPCPYFGDCPGCSYQHLSYELELKLKGKRIASCLRKFGGTDIEEVSVMPSPVQYGYRSHVTLHLWYNGLDTWCGLIEPDQRRIVDIGECLLLPDFAKDLPGRVKQICSDLIGSYKGKLALRLPFYIDHRGKRMMLAPGRSPMRKTRRMMKVVLDAVQDAFPPDAFIERTFSGRKFRFNLLSFTQANEFLMPSLYQAAKDALGDWSGGKLLDLYSGVGVLGTISSTDAGVTFIEYSPTAVEDLKFNAGANGLANADIVEGDVVKLLPGILKKGRYSAAILNPPRNGLHKDVPELIGKSGINKLLYVSCNPATLGRDVGRFTLHGFKPDSARGADMFPRTPHVESVVVLSR
jgi:23S rRNA (uracil1939-C5)-methyltransferase